jgi:hypothetical protein
VAALGKGIFGQAEQQLTNLIVVLRLELQPSPDYTFFERQGLVRDEIGDDLLHLFRLLTRIF